MFQHIPVIWDGFEALHTLLPPLMFLGEALDKSLLHLSASFEGFVSLIGVSCDSFVRSLAWGCGAFQVLLATCVASAGLA